jgi:hypothetical protein
VTTTETLRPAFSLPPREVLSALGYNGSVPPRVERAVANGLEKIGARARPVALCREVPIEPARKGFRIAGTHLVGSPRLGRAFRPCRRGIVFVASLGPGVDELAAETSREGLMEGFIMDFLGSMAIEDALDAMEKTLRDGLGDGEAMTPRYSPGYCEWAIEDQRVIFGLVDNVEKHVELTEHFIMKPRKSVSGVIGIGERTDVERQGNACRYCGRKTCEYRRQT